MAVGYTDSELPGSSLIVFLEQTDFEYEREQELLNSNFKYTC
jgi:hypothetical protein